MLVTAFALSQCIFYISMSFFLYLSVIQCYSILLNNPQHMILWNISKINSCLYDSLWCSFYWYMCVLVNRLNRLIQWIGSNLPSCSISIFHDSTTYYCLVIVIKFRLWYRHSGEPEIEDIPYDCKLKIIEDDSKIIKDIGNHSITHMFIWNGVIPSLEVVAPRLTHLKISFITESTELQRYVYFLN